MRLQTFFDNFALLSDTPNGVAKLRELILDLAIQGKLVSQDEVEEPASVLLEKIKQERKVSARAKEIRNGNESSLLEDGELPFSIPQSWQWVRLGALGNAQTGTTPSKSVKAYFGNDYPFIKPADIFPSRVEYENEGLSQKAIGNGGRLAPSGSILMVCIGTIGKVNVIERNCSFNQQINSITLYSHLNPYLFNYFLRSGYFQNEAWSKSSRTTIAILNKGKWERIPVPLPPLEEQKRIVAKVDELMRLCDELEARQQAKRESRVRLNNATLAPLNNATSLAPEEFEQAAVCLADNFAALYDSAETVGKLRSTILQLAVQGKLVPQDPDDEPASALFERVKKDKPKLVRGKKSRKTEPNLPFDEESLPFTLPSSWLWCRLVDLGITQTGTTPPTSKAEYFGNDYPFIKPADITNNGINYEKDGLSTLGVEVGRLVPADSVLMVSIGGSIGKVGIVDRECSCNQQINYITLQKGVISKLLYYYLKSPYFQEQVLSLAPKTTLPILSKGKWDLIPVPLPPLEEQKRIVAKVSQLMALCDELEAKLRQTEADSEKLMKAAVRDLLASVGKGEIEEALSSAV